MLNHIPHQANTRKHRLFVCACFRRVEATLDPEARKALELSERFADGHASAAEMRSAVTSRGSSHARVVVNGPSDYSRPELFAALAVSGLADATGRSAESAAQSLLFRDIFGNPFCPVTFDPRWRTSDVVDLAQAIYDDKAFERMPILADALMDAGCEEEQIIDHCRGEGPHVRGCWVVDLVLGKK
jgi:hypothetical protein